MSVGTPKSPAWAGAGGWVRDTALVLLLLLQLASARGADFLLQWEPLTPQQAVLSPASTPNTALTATPPSPVRREPKTVSRYPLYGRLQLTKHGPLLFRLDEAGGSGNGYDRLIFDFNRNGDLSDDPEQQGTVLRTAESPYAETSLFGPVTNAPEWKAGPWPAPLALKVSLRKRTWWGRLQVAPRSPVLIGRLEAHSCWYLQTTAAVGGRQEPLGFWDCNCNFNLGETPSAVGPRNQRLSFTVRDLLLRDFDRNGTFDFTALFTDTQGFPNVLCVGTNVFSVELDASYRFVRLQPYVGPVGEVRLSEKMESASLGWYKNGIWTLLTVGLEQGKATVPAGRYCLHSCVLRGADTEGRTVFARGVNNTVTNSFEVVQGQITRVRCGPPIEPLIETRFFPAETRRGVQDLGRLNINVRVTGAGGEIYASFARGPELTVRSAPPKFRVTDESGQTILSGQLEYG